MSQKDFAVRRGIRTANDKFVAANGKVGINTSNLPVSLVVASNDAIQLPVGNNAQRPTTGVSNGMFRYSSQSGYFEGYMAGQWRELLTQNWPGTYIVEAANGTSNTEFFRLSPNNYSSGRPYFHIKKSATANLWHIGLWDGGSTNGTIDFQSTGFTHQGNTVAVLNRVQGWNRQQYFQKYWLTDGANISWNLELAQLGLVTLGGNRTLLNPTNPVDGGIYILIVQQDGTGNRTLSYGNTYQWAGGSPPELSTGAWTYNVFTFLCSIWGNVDNSEFTMLGTATTNFA